MNQSSSAGKVNAGDGLVGEISREENSEGVRVGGRWMGMGGEKV